MRIWLKKEIWYQWLRTQAVNLRHTAFQSIITGLQITNAMAKVNMSVLNPATAMTAPAYTGPKNIPIEYAMLYRAYTNKSAIM